MLEGRSPQKDVDYVIRLKRRTDRKRLPFMLLQSTNIQQDAVLTLVNRHFSVAPSLSLWTVRHHGIQLSKQNGVSPPPSCVVSLVPLLSSA